MRVLVLGQRGMLGHVVSRYLREQGHIITEGQRYDGAIELRDAEAVVNCAGVVSGTQGLFMANALLPLHIAARLEGRVLVQPSTDCVFDGKRGWYSVDDESNATDDYGLSKRLGEGCLAFPGVVVLRTSIIGPGERGLLGWFLRQERADGWTDHIWNGITSLTWAELAGDAITGRIAPGLHQPTSTTITKCDLLRLVGEVFDHRIEVRPVTTEPRDRSLVPTITTPPLREQLIALRKWHA